MEPRNWSTVDPDHLILEAFAVGVKFTPSLAIHLLQLALIFVLRTALPLVSAGPTPLPRSRYLSASTATAALRNGPIDCSINQEQTLKDDLSSYLVKD